MKIRFFGQYRPIMSDFSQWSGFLTEISYFLKTTIVVYIDEKSENMLWGRLLPRYQATFWVQLIFFQNVMFFVRASLKKT